MEECDRISSLADEILLHILSSLPFESAIQTLTLSKRWASLWNTPLLRHGPSHRAADSVFSFMSSFNPTTRKLSFHFTDADGSVLSAIIAPNSKLHLHFSSPPANDQLFHLQLHFSPQFTPSFIKSLHLKGVASLTSEAAASIFTKLHSLETLKISDCNCLQCLSIASETKLQSLTIFDCLRLEYVHLKCFKLKTFRYKGVMPSIWPEYHYNLEDAFLGFRLGRVNGSCNFDSVLLTIKNVRVLTLHKWIFQELICGTLSRFHAEFRLYRVKQVWWIDNQYDGDALFSFLKLCPSLESLFVTIEPESCGVEKASEWKCIEGGRYTKLTNLKVVALNGFTDHKDEIDLAERLREMVTAQPLIYSVEDGNDLSGIMHPHMAL